MKVWLLYIGVFSVIVMGFTTAITLAENPEKVILGEWEEISWEYEMLDESQGKLSKEAQSPKEIKQQVGQDLIIHKAETWEFLPNGRLRLVGEEGEEIVHWRIKGRGEILQLRHQNNNVEKYSLTELTDNKMTLNFDVDIQARGIAKLTFEKTDNN